MSLECIHSSSSGDGSQVDVRRRTFPKNNGRHAPEVDETVEGIIDVPDSDSISIESLKLKLLYCKDGMRLFEPIDSDDDINVENGALITAERDSDDEDERRETAIVMSGIIFLL